ncbi:hypothetical protein SLA2020_190740 [Shorea laevis]
MASPLFFLLLLHSAFLVSTSASFTTSLLNQTETLLKWKASLDNQSQSFLSSWVGDSPCNWVGIGCDRVGSVTNISLPNFGLKGTLDKLNFLAFPNLIYFNLGNNSLYGAIPSEIVNLSKLTFFNLSTNDKFSGNIPKNIGRLSSLAILDLARNQLSGSIPSDVGFLNSLTNLSLYNNNFSGSIPASIGNLTNLSFLSLFNNNFSGSIPTSIGNLTKLSLLQLNNNKFSGPIPIEINNLTVLKRIQLSNNGFTGYLPDNICIGERKFESLMNLGKSKGQKDLCFFYR